MRKLVEVAYEITHKCNLKCNHCYNNHLWLGPDKEEMSTEQALKALDKLRNFGVEKLKIGGGEPLLREDLFVVHDYAIALGFEVNFSSNGLLINDKMESILRHNVEKIQISLDGIEDKPEAMRNYKGLFNIVEQAVKELSRNKIKVNIATTLTSANKDELEKILAFCKENHVYRWKIMKYIPDKYGDRLLLSKENYKLATQKLLAYKTEQKSKPEIIVAREFDLIEQPADYNDMQCFGGKSFASMKPNGDITPCSYLYTAEYGDFVCGNIKKNNIENIWNSEKMVKFSKDYENPACDYADKCRGGCKAIGYRLSRLGVTCDPYCWVMNNKDEKAKRKQWKN
ncbi:MAG TPA: radical SAM protein [Candidatus Nanoarchaeia archaeon]|nr:radical SAM protein [Candidatus Nanoarchaeia archaeon]